MSTNAPHRLGDTLLIAAAGLSSFVLSLGGLLYLTQSNEKLLASLGMGVFALLVCWIAAERPNGRSARASAALVDRLLWVEGGDLTTPAPRLVHETMPAVGKAVDLLFTQVRASIDSANAVAFYDPVTTLPNRVHFRREAERRLATADPAKMTAMMFVDLDRFKAVNDSLGHALGDEALTVVAARLRAVADRAGGSAADAPLVARLAGDEFTLLFSGIDDAAQACRWAREALSTLSQPFELGDHLIDIGASIGVALCPLHARDVASLMRASDMAMYQAKSTGRGRVCIFDECMARCRQVRVTTQSDLRAALANGEFAFHFQPRIAFGSGELLAIEAKLRWHHPREGLRLPKTFLPVAESCGLVAQIGDWAIGAVHDTLRGWSNAGNAAPLALEVSPRLLGDSKFLATLGDALGGPNTDLARLELGFSEAAAMAMSSRDLADLAVLRDRGVASSLLDLGLGPLNLARLMVMPLDSVAIAPSLTSNLPGDEITRVVVHAIVQMVRGLGCVPVAQCVESTEQAALLRLIGCDVLHAPAFVEPMSAADLTAWMSARDQAAGSIRSITRA